MANLIWSLGYGDVPDYEKIHFYLAKQITIQGGQADFVFDWNNREEINKLRRNTDQFDNFKAEEEK